MKNPDVDIDIAVQDNGWPECQALIHDAIHHAMNMADMEPECQELSIVLSHDAFVQTLNREYRGKDKPTNVLSFPQDHEGVLGDIILARETLEIEAEEQKITFEDHLSHLIVHGFLHLLGYEHETDKEAAEMESLEIQILKRMNIKNPYAT